MGAWEASHSLYTGAGSSQWEEGGAGWFFGMATWRWCLETCVDPLRLPCLLLLLLVDDLFLLVEDFLILPVCGYEDHTGEYEYDAAPHCAVTKSKGVSTGTFTVIIIVIVVFITAIILFVGIILLTILIFIIVFFGRLIVIVYIVGNSVIVIVIVFIIRNSIIVVIVIFSIPMRHCHHHHLHYLVCHHYHDHHRQHH